MCGIVGLLVSYHANLPSGPAIVLTAGVIHLVSMILGPNQSVVARHVPRPHLGA